MSYIITPCAHTIILRHLHPLEVFIPVYFGTYLECNSTTPGLQGCVEKQDIICLRRGTRSWTVYHQLKVHLGQGFMQDQIIASHICFGGHMDVN